MNTLSVIQGVEDRLIQGGEKMLSRKKAQSTLEYITVFAAIVAAIVLFAYTRLRPAVESVLGSSASKITEAATTFSSTISTGGTTGTTTSSSTGTTEGTID